MASLLQETEAAVIDASAEQGVEAEGVDAASAALRATIPSFRTITHDGTAKGKKFTVYQIKVQSGQAEWVVERRYTQFYVLYSQLKHKYEDLKSFGFPRKKLFSTLAAATVESRREKFETLLLELLQLSPRPYDLNAFLQMEEHGGSVRALSSAGNTVGIQDFELLKVLGKGSFGKVFLVRKYDSQELFAMKVLKKSEVKRRKQIEHTKTERRIMGGTGKNHPFIVGLRFAFQNSKKLYMVTDYCRGGELFFHLKRLHVFKEDMVRFYSAEIVAALAHLHANDIVYRDLKPENVLLDSDGHVRITDFGLSRDNVVDDHSAMTFCGTPEYLSPEMILHRKTRSGYGKSVDWWSLGTLMFEMLTGWPPFYDRDIRAMCEKILHAPLKFPQKFDDTISEDARSIVEGLLQRDLSMRLGSGTAGVDGIFSHPFYAPIDWNELMARRIEPPFKPRVKNDTDLQNFDKTFTKLPAQLTPPGKDSPVGKAIELDFESFTYTADSPLGGLSNEEDVV